MPIKRQIAGAAQRARTWLRENGARTEFHRQSSDRVAIDWFLVLSHSQMTARQQAAYLGISVDRRRRRLYRAGRITLQDRYIPPKLTPERRAAITSLFYEDGYSLTGVADRCNISARVVGKVVCEEHRSRAPFVMTPEVSRIFTITENTVRIWIAYGWLPASKSSDGARAHYRWQRADLFDFVRNPATWIAWQPTQITDPELRNVAELARSAVRGRWWTIKEIAAHHNNLAVTTLLTYVLNNKYLNDVAQTRYGRARFFWIKGDPPPITRRLSAAD